MGAGTYALAPTKLFAMPGEHDMTPAESLMAAAYAHLHRAAAAYEESRRNGEFDMLRSQEPDPADFLEEDEDGTLFYRMRSHGEAQVALDLGLAALTGVLRRLQEGELSLEEARKAAAGWRDWVAKAETEVWADYDPQKWPQIALALQETRLAATLLAESGM